MPQFCYPSALCCATRIRTIRWCRKSPEYTKPTGKSTTSWLASGQESMRCDAAASVAAAADAAAAAVRRLRLVVRLFSSTTQSTTPPSSTSTTTTTSTAPHSDQPKPHTPLTHKTAHGCGTGIAHRTGSGENGRVRG